MDKIELKKILIAHCMTKLQHSADELKKAMDSAQEEANAHKGAMQSRYDTFKEEAQALRNGFAQQLDSVLRTSSIINQISPQITDNIQLGSVVETSDGNYFISTGIVDEPIKVDGKEYLFINFGSPICQALKSSRVGDKVSFRGKNIEIVDIF